MSSEMARLEASYQQNIPWKKWGPYLSERQWGTVREDYRQQVPVAQGDAQDDPAASRYHCTVQETGCGHAREVSQAERQRSERLADRNLADRRRGEFARRPGLELFAHLIN